MWCVRPSSLFSLVSQSIPVTFSLGSLVSLLFSSLRSSSLLSCNTIGIFIVISTYVLYSSYNIIILYFHVRFMPFCMKKRVSIYYLCTRACPWRDAGSADERERERERVRIHRFYCVCLWFVLKCVCVCFCICMSTIVSYIFHQHVVSMFPRAFCRP